NTAESVLRDQPYLVLYPNAGDLWWKPGVDQKIRAPLEEVLRQFHVDENRVYIAGFSNGGTGGLGFGAKWPHRFAAAGSVMGAGTCVPEVAKELANLTDVPILLVHGDQDPRISLECSTATEAALRELPARTSPVLHVLTGRKHDVVLEDDGGFTLPFLDSH